MQYILYQLNIPQFIKVISHETLINIYAIYYQCQISIACAFNFTRSVVKIMLCSMRI